VVVISRKKERPLSYLSGFIRGVLGLRRQHFDLFVNLYSGGSSPLLTRLSGARIRLGFDHTPALRKANNLLVKKPDFCQHWTKDLGKKLRPLGIGDDKIRRGTTFVIPEQAKLEAAKLLSDQAGLVAFNLGAGVAEKRWPVERFVELARKIHDKYDLKPVVFTNPGMETLSHEFAEQYGKQLCHVMPILPLATVAALMRQCVAVITGDTSLMHLAIGIKAPNLTLFTYTRPEIVEPEDCLHVACFVEKPDILDKCNKPVGTTDIPVEFAMEKFNVLMNQIQTGKEQ
jgi:ADP-heptose:LPS heptosyltransferase